MLRGLWPSPLTTPVLRNGPVRKRGLRGMQPPAGAGHGGAAAAAAGAPPPPAAPAWRRLGTPPSQLTLDFTLPTGQSFRWRRAGPGEYAGVAGGRVLQLRQERADVAWRVLARAPGLPEDEGADAAALAEYFSLGVNLEALYAEWAAADARFAKVGARMGCVRV
jgi:N-glycosylase/DNA lyase